MMKTELGLDDLALIFKVRVELNRSNLSMCVGVGVICSLLIFFKISFFEKFFQEYHQSVKTD